MFRIFRRVAFVVAMMSCRLAFAYTDWSSQDYDLYPGDFDGDGKSDVLYVAKSQAKTSGIARSDGAGPNIPWQSWPSNFLGIPWFGNNYNVLVADFNGDGRADIFLQARSSGDHYLLFADSQGKISGVSQTISNSSLGVVWSADQHRIVMGDFNGDQHADLFLQSTTRAGLNAVMLSTSSNDSHNGKFESNPYQSWNASPTPGGFSWSTQDSIVYAGDFNGDTRADLLIQARPRFVLIDFDVPIPVPTFQPNTFGVVLAQNSSTIFSSALMKAWNRNAQGVDWSPLATNVVVGDFNNDGRADVLLQARNSSKTSYLLTEDGSTNIFGTGSAISANVAIAADSVRLFTARFGGASGGAALYIQALQPSGANAIASSVSTTISASIHDSSTATGVLPSTAVGITAGAFAVSDQGAASYTVPIKVPPGVNKVEPSLAIRYQSGGGNGALGVGWGIGGLSAIERCGKNLASDNAISGVQLTVADSLCLDGNKLRLTGGVYGYAGSTYQTELEQFARVTAQGTGGQPASYFTVETKDGFRYEYGNTADSFIESTAPGFTTVARTWAVNKVNDRNGNAMTVTYQEDGPSGNGSFRQLSIDYTSNASVGLAAAYKVSFVWETRPSGDILVGYFAGGRIAETQRLSRIETKYNDPSVGNFRLVRSYRFSYNTSGTTPRSRLGAIQECDKDGYCLSPTVIGWQGGALGWAATTEETTSTSSSAALMDYVQSIDVDGDGRTDLVYPQTVSSTTYWFVMRANGSGGFATPVQSSINAGDSTAKQYSRALPMDYSGDGKIGLLAQVPGFSTLQLLRWNGSNLSQSNTNLSATIAGAQWTGDFNGDSRMDFVYVDSSGTLQVQTNLGSGTSFGTAQPYGSPGLGNTIINPNVGSAGRVLDFNADGRTDLVYASMYQECIPATPVCTFNSTYGIMYSTVSSFVQGPTWQCQGVNAYCPGLMVNDFNGDGQLDVISPTTSFGGATSWQMSLGTGTGVTAAYAVSIPYQNQTQLVADYDGDGKQDLLYSASGSTYTLLRFNGTDFEAPISTTIPIVSGSVSTYRIIDIDGDGQSDIGFKSFDYRVRKHNGAIGDLVSSITDGFGNSVSVTYAPLTDPTVHTKGSTAVFPEIDLSAPINVVKQYTTNDGVGSAYTVTASYTGARMHVQGRGYEGFSSVAFTDSRTGIKTTRNLKQNFPFIGMAASIAVTQPNGKTIDLVSNDYLDSASGSSPNDRHFPYLRTSTHTKYEVSATNGTIDGQPVTQVVTTNGVDAYGNTTSVGTVATDLTGSNQSYSSATVNTIPSFDLGNWCLDFVTQQVVTKIVPNRPTVSRTVQYVLDSANPSKCRASQQIVEPAQSPWTVTTTYQFDGFGHVNQTTVAATGILNRVTTTSYGAQGVFPVSLTNAENETEGKTYDYALGVPKTATDVNGIVTTWQYDSFGRKNRESRPDGTATTWTIYGCDIGNSYCGDSLLRAQIYEQQFDTGNNVTRYSLQRTDSMGRPKYQEALAFSGANSIIRIDYDNQGRVARSSAPYFSGATPYYTSFTYDLIGRVLTDKEPVNEADAIGSFPYCVICSTSQYSYSKLSTTLTDANGNTNTKALNAIGLVVQMTDAASGTIQYGYDAFDNLDLTTDPAGNQISAGSNIRGLKTTSNDPDLGNWVLDYYPTGELKTQTDAKGQVASFTYDRVGRMRTRTEAEGVTTINYGASSTAHNIGRVETVSSAGYAELRTYDSLGRPQELRTTVDGTDYYTTSSYSSVHGQLETVTYPASTSAVPASRFKVRYDYSHGILQAVKDFNTPTTVYWQRVATDSAGRTIDEQFGNNLHTYSTYDNANGLLATRFTGSSAQIQNLQYQWDKVGNLSERKDLGLQLTEHFYYDSLNRLDYSTLKVGSSAATVNLDPAYNGIGNITSKTGVGSYDYAAAQSGCTYTTNGVPNASQPHAVRNAGGVIYCYDANGNMTKRGSGTVSWTSYNVPSLISSGGNSAQFFYDAARARYKQISTTTTGLMPAGVETTIYIGGLFEKITKPTGVVEYRHSIIADKDIAALRTLRSNGVNDTRYLHKDHLGSIDTVTNEVGTVVAKLSYDAFGGRRNPSTWSGSPVAGDWTTIASLTHRGFTEHESLDNLNLIHMGGRVYDPVIGRFLSADPFVQIPLMSQSFNRYSYVFNNPLSFVDPSGFFLKGLFNKIGDMFEAIGRNINYIVAAVLYVVAAVAYAYGYTVVGNELSSIATALVKSPVQLTRGRSGGIGVSVGYAGFGVTADPSTNTSAGPPADWGHGGPGTVAGVPVLYENTVDGSHRSYGIGDFLTMLNNAITSPAFVDFSSGLGDALTFGLTRKARDNWDIGAVDTSSTAYQGGEVTGIVVSIAATGGVGAARTAAVRGTGAFIKGAQGGVGLGRLASATMKVSEKGLAIVERHLAQFGDVAQNRMMIARLRAGLSQGRAISGADAIFYSHELAEATMMARGMSYEAAHAAALAKYGVSPFSVYHPEVIAELGADYFNANWRRFWNLE